jgi:hypothetical protein
MTELTIEKRGCFFLSKGLTNNIFLLKIKGLLFNLLTPILLAVMLFNLLVDLCVFAMVRRNFYHQNGEFLDLEFFKNNDINELRDIYIDLFQHIKRTPVINFFMGALFKRAMIRWDDLVEDITIATDDEFKNLITQIANKIR